jgi:hypothetical protein
MKKLVIVLVVLLIIAGILGALYLFTPLFKGKKLSEINTFEDCEAAKQLVVDTHPRECHMKDGRVFYEEGNAFDYKGVIEVTIPAPKDVVDSPFKIEGKAIPTWFYNNQLEMRLVDEQDQVLGVGYAKAQDKIDPNDNTTPVAFIGVINFRSPTSEKGKLLINKTNPAEQDSDGNPIKPGPLIVPVRFNYTPSTTPTVPQAK